MRGHGSRGKKGKMGKAKEEKQGTYMRTSNFYVPWNTKFPAYFSTWGVQSGLTSQFLTGIFQFLQVKGILVPCIWILFVVSTKLDADYLIGSAYLIY